MKSLLFLALAIVSTSSLASADIQVTCDTGLSSLRNPFDDVGSTSPLQISISGNATYTQDMKTPNKTYTLTLPDNFNGRIEFSSSDGAYKFVFDTSSYKGNWSSELDADGPNGMKVITGSNNSASASLSLNPGSGHSAFVYCNQVK